MSDPFADCVSYVKSRVKYMEEIGICEFGIDGIRLDAIVVHYLKQQVRGFEFKVSRADFLADKKWRQYLKYCNRFYFLCPPGIIKKDEVDSGAGLIYVGIKGEWQDFKLIKRAKHRDVEKDIYTKVISNMLMRAKQRKEEIF